MRSDTDKIISYHLFIIYFILLSMNILEFQKTTISYLIETANLNLIKNLTKFFIIKNRSKIRYRERSECPSLDWRFS